ncbi:MAG: MarC family protein [Fidelibacterota bacterium]
MDILKPALNYALLCVSTLLTLVNPLGIAPLFMVLTERFDSPQRHAIVRKATLTGGITLLVFALVGSYIFRFYGITLNAFHIMGGIIFFRSGLRMLEGNVLQTRTTPKEQEESLQLDDIAISPLGIPLITGPGAITAALVLSGQATGPTDYAILVASILLVLVITYYVLRGADRLSRRLGTTGMRIIQRIMGIILMVIAVQFVINGVTPIFQSIMESVLKGT